jgi:hypothetical protein
VLSTLYDLTRSESRLLIRLGEGETISSTAASLARIMHQGRRLAA